MATAALMTLHIGQRIQLVEMPHDPCPIDPGTTGTVTKVTVYDHPQPSSYSIWEDGKPVVTGLRGPPTEAEIQVAWDDGRKLSLLVPKDRFILVDD
jgi:hypothetical protein